MKLKITSFLKSLQKTTRVAVLLKNKNNVALNQFHSNFYYHKSSPTDGSVLEYKSHEIKVSLS